MRLSRIPLSCVVTLLLLGCGSSRTSSFEDLDGSTGTSSSSGGGSNPFGTTDSGTPSTSDGGGTTTTATTIYANTDDSLYSLDPSSNAITLVGKLTGSSDAFTDCAVDADGNVFVNTATTIYKTTLPVGGVGAVQVTKVADIASSNNQRFYALAFAPAGVFGANEILVGGDTNGELWSIDPASGATKDLGSFGPDKSNVFALSGDIVFYDDASGKPTGLATIRSCQSSSGGNCTATNDYLAGIDMTAIVTAYTSNTPAKSLLRGIYGGSATTKGNGTGHGELFGLGAWKGSVFGFERAKANDNKPALLTIDTTNGTGTVIPSAIAFTNGWSGACVTTKVSVTVPPPPDAPK